MKCLGVCAAISIAGSASAEPTYLALYLKGSKIGYSSYETANVRRGGHLVSKSTSLTVLNTALLGSNMEVSMNSTSWATPSGAPLRMTFLTKSSGRSNEVEATFGAHVATVTVRSSGSTSSRKIPLPLGGDVVDDPLTDTLKRKLQKGQSRVVYVFDSATISFLKNRVTAQGDSIADVNGRKIRARLITIEDPTSKMEVFLDNHDDVVRVNAAMGITMLPVSKKVALAPNRSGEGPADLAVETSIHTDKAIENPDSLKELKIRITCPSISSIPSDAYQQVSRSGKSWIVDICPARHTAEGGSTNLHSTTQKKEWLQPSLYMPSDSPHIRKLALSIIGSNKDVDAASHAIQLFVYRNMKFNSGIGVLRDANEILKTREGVCRDFAVLTVTLLRAAGILAKLASGLVNGDGAFFYHAWAQAWDGKRWIGVDSTTDRAQLSASHVKLGEGNIDTAFTFSFLDSAKIEVLNVQKD